jgi:transposase InsO family protein
LLACHQATPAAIINRKNVAANSQAVRSHLLGPERNAPGFCRLRARFGNPIQLAGQVARALPSVVGMTHVRTSPFYPQSNGKIERWHKSLKRECIRPLTPLTLDDARRLIQIYVDHYNTVRLHSAIGM